VDPVKREVIFISKRSPQRLVYSIPLPEKSPRAIVKAKKIATIKLPGATAMDISPDGRRAVMLSYGPAYEFTRGEKETWAQAFARKPRAIAMPWRRQGESICYGVDGKSLYLTSEKLPTPLWKVPVKE
jgi:hypothetical protein